MTPGLDIEKQQNPRLSEKHDSYSGEHRVWVNSYQKNVSKRNQNQNLETVKTWSCMHMYSTEGYLVTGNHFFTSRDMSTTHLRGIQIIMAADNTS